ncbi:uncharacterized protein C8orf74 homolog [Antedon mediterranea]|uniref:uncharacterized protein C8orf74 homolog n=1 Tax=Antedon mediterranea TaxID=105859 RepID=UPI003AF444B8
MNFPVFLTTQSVSKIVSLPKEGGQMVLADYLGYNAEDFLKLKNSILLDFHYNNLMLAVDSGFSLQHSTEMFKLGQEMLQECTGVELPQAIEIYQEKVLHLSNSIEHEKLKLFTNHFFGTFMKHYRLYQFVLTQGQEPMSSEVNVHVIPPVECQQLKDAKILNIWEYEQKLNILERDEENCKTTLNKQKQEEEYERESQKHNQFTVDSSVLNREIISEMIKRASEAESTYEEKLLKLEVEEAHEDLDYYLQKTALPRPAVLGAPPRTKDPPKLPSRGKSSSKTVQKIGLEPQIARGSTRGSRSKAK